MDDVERQPDPEIDKGLLIKELGELRALTSGLLGSVPGAVIVLDNQWRLFYLNDEAVKIFDRDRASLIGKPLQEVYPKQIGRMLSPQTIKDLLTRKERTIDKYTHYLHKWFKISACTFDHGIFIRMEDITAEMLVNRLLRLNEFSVDSARDMVFWVKISSHIIYANKAMCGSLGYSKEEITRIKMGDIDPFLAGHKWAGFVHDLKNAGSITYESSFQARSGSVIPVEVNCTYLEYYNDEYLMAFARNITERKRAEKAIMESKAEAELYVDLMGHDINNMNQVALGFLELALDMMQTQGKIDESHINLIAKPYEMLQNSSRLIENVRKIQRERLGHFKPEIIDMGKILQEVKNSFSHVVGREVTITLIRDCECQVGANELLKDVFTNLIGNSIKHSSGPLLITIEMKSVVEEGKAYCRVSVEDNGPGISDEMKNKLLNRLSPEKSRARGKGFGLYLIKQLVDDFHGKFWMEDRVSGDYTKGARFVVLLPIVE